MNTSHPREPRAVVGELTQAGMSTRAIAPVVGVNQATVVRDLAAGDASASPAAISVADEEVIEPTGVQVLAEDPSVADQPEGAASPAPSVTDALLDEWEIYGRAAGHSDRTIAERAGTIRRLSTYADPVTIDRGSLIAWMASLTKADGTPVSVSAKATYRAHLRAFYGWLAEAGHRSDDPSQGLPRPHAPRGIPHPVTPSEVDRILAACSDTRAATTRAYVILGAFAGLRVHEIAKVRGEDIRGGELLVTGKGGTASSVPLHPVIARLAESMPRSGWWFPTDSPTGHVHRCSVSSAISRAMKRADVVAVPHALRHHFCTQVLRASGGDLRTTQRAARHATPATTAMYTQVADETLTRAVFGIPTQIETQASHATEDDTLAALEWQPSIPCEATRPENVAAHRRETPDAKFAVRRRAIRQCCGLPYPDAGRVVLTCEDCVNRLTRQSWACDACQRTDLPYTTWYEITPL